MSAPLNFDQLIVAPGQQGPPGPAGPASASVANPAAANVLPVTNFLPYATTIGIQSLGGLFVWQPNSVATPDNITVVAAQVGNWVLVQSQFVTAILGEQLVGGIDVDGESAVTGFGVAGGQTGAINLRFNPNGGTQVMQLTTGEMVGAFVRVMFRSAVSLTVTGATAGTPGTVMVASSAGVVSQSRIFVTGVGGFSGLQNLGCFASVNGNTISLYSDFALTQPITTTGTYTSGGAIVCEDFGHFERTIVLRETHGITTNPVFTTSDADVTSPPPNLNAAPSLIGVTASLGFQNNTVQLNLSAPANCPITGTVRCSYMRDPVPGAGHVPIVNQPLITSGTAAGGTVVAIAGQFFTGATQVTFDGVPAASFSVLNDGSISATTAAQPGGLGGSGDVAVTTPNGTGSVGSGSAWTYLGDPVTILGASAIQFRGTPASIQFSGAAVTGWNDTNTAGANFPQNIPVSVGTPLYTALSNFVTPPAPSITTNGTNNRLGITGNTFKLGATNQPVYIWAVIRYNGNGYAICLGTTVMDCTHSVTQVGPGVHGMCGNVGWGTSTSGTTKAIEHYSDGLPATPNTEYVAVSGGTKAILSANGIFGISSPTTLCVGGRDDGGFTALEIFELVIATVGIGGPSDAQRAAIQTYATRVYGSV